MVLQNGTKWVIFMLTPKCCVKVAFKYKLRQVKT